MGYPTFNAVDQFCGAGGTSTGLALELAARGIDHVRLHAINHWPVALETHRLNHPWATHWSEALDRLNPREVVPDGLMGGALTSSPECTYHSIARGAKPINDQLRATAYEVIRWTRELRPSAVLVENVPEFQRWGPLDAHCRPIPEKAGSAFRVWLGRLKALGYTVDYRVLDSADYGAVTSRRRLFVQAREGSTAVNWPVPTHASRAKPVTGRAEWRPAAEVIDWDLQGQSLWGRMKPLAFATTRRILRGLTLYGGAEIQPFVRKLCVAIGVEYEEESVGKFKGFILPPLGRHARGSKANRPRSPGVPFHTFVASKGNGHVVQPFLVPVVGRRASSAVDPKSTADPFPAFQTRVGMWLTDAVLVPRHGERKGQRPRAHPVQRPFPTLPAGGPPMLARAFLVKYYGRENLRGNTQPVSDPLPTLTTKDRLMVVRPVVIDGLLLDIRVRMIQQHELSAGMGFAPSYQFAGNRTEIVKQIGNAVEVNMARALFGALLDSSARRTLDSYGG